MEKTAETVVKIVIVETVSSTGEYRQVGESSRRNIAESTRPDANDQRRKISAELMEGWRVGGEKNCESGEPRSKSFYFPCDDDAPAGRPGSRTR